jgi:hypothetical protein
MKHIRHRVPILSDKNHLSLPVSSVILDTHGHSPAYWRTGMLIKVCTKSFASLYGHFIQDIRFCLAVKLNFNSVDIQTLRKTGLAYRSTECHYVTLKVGVQCARVQLGTVGQSPPPHTHTHTHIHILTSKVTFWSNFLTL